MKLPTNRKLGVPWTGGPWRGLVSKRGRRIPAGAQQGWGDVWSISFTQQTRGIHPCRQEAVKVASMTTTRVYKEPSVAELEGVFSIDHLFRWARITGDTGYQASMAGSLLAALGVAPGDIVDVAEFANWASDDLEATMSSYPGCIRLAT